MAGPEAGPGIFQEYFFKKHKKQRRGTRPGY
jgi:hypothetical protein